MYRWQWGVWAATRASLTAGSLLIGKWITVNTRQALHGHTSRTVWLDDCCQWQGLSVQMRESFTMRIRRPWWDPALRALQSITRSDTRLPIH
jgi:hypothetical protein